MKRSVGSGQPWIRFTGRRPHRSLPSNMLVSWVLELRMIKGVVHLQVHMACPFGRSALHHGGPALAEYRNDPVDITHHGARVPHVPRRV